MKDNLKSTYEEEKLSKLGELLPSNHNPLEFYNKLTVGIRSQTYKYKHLKLAIRVFSHHEKQSGSNKLTSFQKSLVDFVEQEKVNCDKLPANFGAMIKKIYRLTKSNNYFVKDEVQEPFNIYSIFPPSAKEKIELQYESLKEYSCSEEVTKSTTLFMESKNIVKNYLRCFVNCFKYISMLDQYWSPESIQQGIKQFRDSYDTSDYSLNTKYHEVQRVLELFSYLKNIGLISNQTVLPKNIKKPSKSSLMRNTNPTISEINIDSFKQEGSMSSAQTLIDNFYDDLNAKLEYLISTARSVIFSCYRKHELSGRTNNSDGMEEALISAMQIVIVNELGINPTPLYSLKVTIDKEAKTKQEFIKVEDDGYVRINIIKWRQRRLQKRTANSSHLPTFSELKIDDINTAFCIQFAILLTGNKRKQLKTNLLWLTEKQKALKKSLSFDRQFRKFCNNYLPSEFSKLEPTLMRIRSSRAMEIYISSGGDVVKTANYLGNKIKTTLSTYIPAFLQEAVYRRKISVFQHLFLVLATANDSDKLKMLCMTQEQYDNCLKEIYKNEDFGGPLFEMLKPKSNSNEPQTESEIFFICSAENFAFALKLIRTSSCTDDEQYQVCLNAVNKASTGNIMQKKMILEAEEILEQEGFKL